MQLPTITLPDAFLETLRAVATDAFGRAAPDGDALAAAIREVSHHYNLERDRVTDLSGQTAALTARLRFFLPRDLFKIWGPLAELQAAGQLPSRRPWRVLDLGAGLGTTTLGIATFAAATGTATGLRVQALDVDDRALSVMASLLGRDLPLPTVSVSLSTRAVGIERLPTLDGPYDLVVAGLSLNELTAATSSGQSEAEQADQLLTWIDGAMKNLAPGGAMVIVEPALRKTSRVLQHIRDRVQARTSAPWVFAPCLGIAQCPLLERPRDWCHASIRFPFPRALSELAKAAGLRQSDPTFSYLTLLPREASLARIGDAERRPLRVVGGPRASKGKLELDVCGEDRYTRLISLDRHRDKRSDVLPQVTRGTVLAVPAQVLMQDPGLKHLRLPPDVRPTLLSRQGDMPTDGTPRKN